MIKKLRLPRMIAPLIIGLVFNYLITFRYFTILPNFSQILATFANFGVIIVLFYIGLGVDFQFMKDLSKNSSIMALNAGHVPFFFGLFATYFFTHDWIQSLFVGIALAITAEEVTVEILNELKLLPTRVGQLIIEAGIIGDIFEIMAIAVLGVFIKTRAQSFTLANILLELAVFVLVIMIMRYYVIEFLLKLPGKDARKYEYFAVAFLVVIIMTITSEFLNFSYVMGALLAGILLKDKLVEDKLYFEEHHLAETLEVFNFGIFHPLIFIWIGFSINLGFLFANITFGIILTILALVGKLLGAILGNYFCKEPLREGVLIGWGLNARGATELFALLIARNQGIITQNLFSAVVFMALVTTIISPIVFKFMVLNGYGIIKRKPIKRVHPKITIS
jgi:Kef-type K+ transport system membrane component KefB